ncbi:MAG: MoaD/ThiS family protein [Deltaproteobacteria bacterium]|nr:MoaD/ThiS family protein [Deltaproteobacteria bacterium]MBW2123065.1 MoaD/ThiS family protein [Deltaproteobacteria bacterium]
MRIRVRFFGSFRDLAGEEIHMTVADGLVVADVVRLLQERIEGFADDFDDETLVVLNDRVVLRNRGEMEPKQVKEGDVIGIFPAVSGGAAILTGETGMARSPLAGRLDQDLKGLGQVLFPVVDHIEFPHQ